MKVVIKTPLGIFKTKEVEATPEEIKKFGDFFESAAGGKLNYLRLDTTEGSTYFGKETLVNSTFTLT